MAFSIGAVRPLSGRTLVDGVDPGLVEEEPVEQIQLRHGDFICLHDVIGGGWVAGPYTTETDGQLMVSPVLFAALSSLMCMCMWEVGWAVYTGGRGRRIQTV